MEDSFDGIITLSDENGAENDYELYDFIEHNDNVYLRLIPLEEEEEENDVAEFIILKLLQDKEDCDECLITVEGAELDAVLTRFEEMDREYDMSQGEE